MRLTVLSGDPGKTNDPFGNVGLEGTWPEKQIFIRLARQFKKEKYKRVAKYYSKVRKQVKPNLILIEKNFDFERLKPAFAHLPITYVTMSANLKPSTRRKGFSIDKPWCIKEIHKLHKRHAIQYPEKLSYDMQELINQRNEMAGINTGTGHLSYKRVRNRHDDLFMAKLIGINAILLWWETLDNNA